MKRPSERALGLAEGILDHVRYGLTRTDALYELAEMIDENNQELLEAIYATFRQAEHHADRYGFEALSQLRDVVRDYQPSQPLTADQRDLFVPQPVTLF